MTTHKTTTGAQTDAPPQRDDTTPADARTEAERTDDAARGVMHPDSHDTDWRYYFGAWGG